jgi:hypothetical protein
MKKLFILSALFFSCEKQDIKPTTTNKVINHYTASFKISGKDIPYMRCFINGQEVNSQEGYDVKTGDSIRITSNQGSYTNTQTMYQWSENQTSSIMINGVTKSSRSCTCMLLNNKYNVN